MLYFSVDSPVGQLTTMAQIQIIEGQKILWINQVFVNPQEDFECQANHSWVFQATCFWKLTSCSVGEPDWCLRGSMSRTGNRDCSHGKWQRIQNTAWESLQVSSFYSYLLTTQLLKQQQQRKSCYCLAYAMRPPCADQYCCRNPPWGSVGSL